MELSTLSRFDTAGRDVIFEHVEVTIVGILFVAEILEQVSFTSRSRNLRRLIGQPIEILADIVKVLRAIKGRLLLGQLSRRPQIEEGMVLAVILVARRDQLIMKISTHRLL